MSRREEWTVVRRRGRGAECVSVDAFWAQERRFMSYNKKLLHRMLLLDAAANDKGYAKLAYGERYTNAMTGKPEYMMRTRRAGVGRK